MSHGHEITDRNISINLLIIPFMSKADLFTQNAYPTEAQKAARAAAAQAAAVEESAPQPEPQSVPEPVTEPEPQTEPQSEPAPQPESAPEAEPQPEPTPEAITPDDLARAVAEAEQRGYLRGRNESISQSMRRNGIWEQPHHSEDAPQPAPSSADGDDDPVLLRRIRPSIWD